MPLMGTMEAGEGGKPATDSTYRACWMTWRRGSRPSHLKLWTSMPRLARNGIKSITGVKSRGQYGVYGRHIRAEPPSI